MTKAFELSALVEKLKARGLDVAEEAAKILVEEVFDWVSESVILTENKFDDMTIAVIPTIKAYALGKVDLIDGEPG